MASAGTIRIGTSINTRGLDKGASVIRSRLKGLQSSVLSASGAMTGLLGVFGISLGTTVFVRSINSAMGDLDRMAKSSAKLGISANEFRALGLAAELTGTDFNNLEKGLQKLVVRLGDMQAGGGQAVKGIEQLGLAAGDFTGDTMTDFKLVADSIRELESPAEKASAAFRFFGKSGVELLTVLEEGSDGIDRMVEEAERLGGSFNDVEFNQLQMANDAVAKMNFAFESIIQKLAIELSPIITALVDQFTDWATSSLDTTSIITDAVSWIADAIGVVADVVHTVKLGFMALQIGVTTVVTGIVGTINLVGKALEGIINLLPGVEVSFTNTTQAMRDDLGKLLDEQIDDLHSAFLEEPPSTGIRQGFENIRAQAAAAAEAIKQAGQSIGDGFSEGAIKATQAAADLIEKLEDSIATFGMSSNEAHLWKLAQAGASEAVLEQARALQSQLDQMTELQKQRDQMLSRADSITSAVQTPLEKFQLEIEELQELFSEGLISEETFARAIEKARDGLGKEDVFGEQELKLSSAAVLGSSEARDAIIRHQFRLPSQETKEEQELKRQTSVQEDIRKLMRELVSGQEERLVIV